MAIMSNGTVIAPFSIRSFNEGNGSFSILIAIDNRHFQDVIFVSETIFHFPVVIHDEFRSNQLPPKASITLIFDAVLEFQNLKFLC